MARLGCVLAVAVFLGLVPLACGSSAANGTRGFSCGQPSICMNQPPPTQADIDQCNSRVNDPGCGAQAVALGQCEAANEKCKPDGTQDEQATAASCASQLAAFTQCYVDAGGG